MKQVFLLGFCALALVEPGTSAAEPLRGAASVLQEAQKKEAAGTGSAEEVFRKMIDDFASTSAALKPPEASSQWVKLVQEYWQLQKTNATPQSALMFGEIFEAVPGPESWSSITAAADALAAENGAPEENTARRDLLRVIASTLNGDYSKVGEEIQSVQAALKKSQLGMALSAYDPLAMLKSGLLEVSDRSADRKQMILDQLSYFEASREQQSWQVPDLVLFVGKEEAEKVLRRAFALPTTSLSFSEGKQTLALARRVALEEISKINIPPWSLVEGPESLALYEALDKKFPEMDAAAAARLKNLPPEGVPMRTDYQREAARQNYIYALILAGRNDDAARELEKSRENLARALGGSAMVHDEQVTRNDARKLATFLGNFLMKHPDYSLWEMYVHVAIAAGDSEELIRMMRDELNNPSLTERVKTKIREQYYPALLAADKVDEAVGEMRKALAEPEVPQTEYGPSGRSTVILALARLGAVLDQPAWMDEAFATWKKAAGKGSGFAEQMSSTELARLFIEKGRFEIAESILAELLQAKDNSSMGYNLGGVKSEALAALVELYSRAGRSGDVLTFLEQAPWWNAKDLAALRGYGMARGRLSPNGKVKLFAAKALLSQGRIDAALALVTNLLDANGGSDPAYELLIQIKASRPFPF